MNVRVLSHKSLPSTYGQDSEYKRWGFCLTVDGKPLDVITEDGQYEYNTPQVDDDDEPIQIAIGEYMEKHGIDPGKIHR